MNLIDRLEQAAKAATPGPWNRHQFNNLITDSGKGSAQLLICTVAMNTYKDQGRYNNEFIAFANPDTILKLIAVVRAAEKITLTSAASPSLDELQDALEELKK